MRDPNTPSGVSVPIIPVYWQRRTVFHGRPESGLSVDKHSELACATTGNGGRFGVARRRLPVVVASIVGISLIALGAGSMSASAPQASAASVGQAIVNAAASQSGQPYCWDGGNTGGPTHGDGNSHGATNCAGSTVGFDCTGLTLYAVYQATGIVLPHDSSQATAAINDGGELITSESGLEPGDIVFFGSSLGDFLHAGVYAGGGSMWDSNTAYWIYPDGVHQREVSAETADAAYGFVGGVRFSSATRLKKASFDINGDGLSDLTMVTGVNGGTTGSGKAEVHTLYGGGFTSRYDIASPWGYLNTTTNPLFMADVNGDGQSDLCMVTGVNGGTTGSGRAEVHCLFGGGFTSRYDIATPWSYLTTTTDPLFMADVNGDGQSDLCQVTGVNGSTTGSGKAEVHCLFGGGFTSRYDVATPWAYLNTTTNQLLDR
jgi:cell wall-associated NlpC family hydrolase